MRASLASSEEKACTKPSANPVADPPWCKQPTRIIRGLPARLRPRYKSLAQGTCEFRSDSLVIITSLLEDWMEAVR